MTKKPLGRKNYGSIPHLPYSRMGPGDHSCHEGQARIATVETRDRHDYVIVQEKLDGSNVGVAKVNGEIIALGRAGYPAQTSPYEQHQLFAHWVRQNYERFDGLLKEGERVVGEWLAQAHGTRYKLEHEPFCPFDIMVEDRRLIYREFANRISAFDFTMPYTVHARWSVACGVTEAMDLLGKYGMHGALDPIEGAVWRIERDRVTGKKGERHHVVDFLVKWVRPDKVDGKYLESISGEEAVWNWRP